MSFDINTTIKGVAAQAESRLAAVQEGVVNTVGAAAKTISAAAPSKDAVKLPQPKELVDSTFDLLSKAAARQKQLAVGLIDALEPLRSAVTGATSKKA
jgi:hypothetical protein